MSIYVKVEHHHLILEVGEAAGGAINVGQGDVDDGRLVYLTLQCAVISGQVRLYACGYSGGGIFGGKPSQSAKQVSETVLPDGWL